MQINLLLVAANATVSATIATTSTSGSSRLWTQRKLTSPAVFCINNSYTVMLVQAAVKSSCTVAVSSRQFYNVNYVLREIRDIGVPDRVHPGRGTKGLKSGTSRLIRDGWQPYTCCWMTVKSRRPDHHPSTAKKQDYFKGVFFLYCIVFLDFS